MKKRLKKKQFKRYIAKMQKEGAVLSPLSFSKERIVLDNGEKIAYIKTGMGKHVIIFVHGNMSSSVHYKPLYDLLPEDIQAYAPDLRGFGDSTYYSSINSLDDFAEDLHNFITKLEIDDFTLVGWSTGGGVCLSYASKHPNLCKKIVLVDSVAVNGYPLYKSDASGKPIKGCTYESKTEMYFDPYQELLITNIANKNYYFINAIWESKVYVVKKPSLYDNYEYLTETLKQRNIIDVQWALATFNMTTEKNDYVKGNGEINKISIPVLCIRGDRDQVVNEKMFEDTINSLGNNATRLMFKQCGHSPFVDCPRKLADAVFNFARPK